MATHFPVTTCIDLMPTISACGGIVVRDDSLRSQLCRGDIMGMAAPLYYSAEMVLALPDDGNRYERLG